MQVFLLALFILILFVYIFKVKSFKIFVFGIDLIFGWKLGCSLNLTNKS